MSSDRQKNSLTALNFEHQFQRFEDHFRALDAHDTPLRSGAQNLQNLYQILQQFGSPHTRIAKPIHIVGTNGKGSTQAFLRSILQAHDFAVHAFTSPHLLHVTERIMLRGTPISETYLSKLINDVISNTHAHSLGWFAGITLLASLAFSQVQADYTLIEAGIGGRLDATNTISHPLCSVVTSISLDHQSTLGPTLEHIAREKAGIFRPNTPVITCEQNPEVTKILKEQACSHKSPFYMEDESWSYDVKGNHLLFQADHQSWTFSRPRLLGDHQLQNCALALATLYYTAPTLFHAPGLISKGICATRWPGRLQKLKEHSYQKLMKFNCDIYLDGAHNQGGIESLVGFIKELDFKPAIIFGMRAGRDLKALIQPFTNHISHLTAVPADDSGSNPCSAQLNQICDVAKSFGITSTPARSVMEALSQLSTLQSPPQVIIICGSLYLTASVLKVNASFEG